MKNGLSVFEAELQTIENEYRLTGNAAQMVNRLDTLEKHFCVAGFIGDYLIEIAEKYMDAGDKEAGMRLIVTVYEQMGNVANKVTLYLRMAQYYFEAGDEVNGTKLLIRLCTETVDNYEESIEFNGLSEVWETYKHLVDGKVPKSLVLQAGPATPEGCTKHISEIFDGAEEELLSDISEHLCELSGNGEYLNCLNKWEKAVFYADELWCEVNSGGFSHYLYYHGHHFEKAFQFFAENRAEKMVQLLDAVKMKFKKAKIPKQLESIQNALERMEDNGMNFDAEDEQFYSTVEKEVQTSMQKYITENREHFR